MPVPNPSDRAAPPPLSGYRGRFAPSPTGELHPGSVLAALGSWLLARAAGGEWWVRIEDLDPPREAPGAADRQLAMLASLGLDADGPVVRQSDRGALYQTALDRLLASGHAFACHCSRSDLAASGGIHRHCVGTAKRQQPAIRLRVAPGTRVEFDDAIRGPQSQDVGATVGDFVLRRADGYWAYQLAVVVDDGAQGITDVVRGADLLDSTARQILLQRALDLATPRYAHLPLLLDEQGRKLSKSDAAQPVDPRDPLPPLRQAWLALGQDRRATAGATTAATWLERARAGFRPGAIPTCDIPPPADRHNRRVTFED